MLSILFISASIVNAGTASDASFNWGTVNIPSTQLDYGEGAQILTAENIVNCDTSAAATVVAVVKQTELLLSSRGKGKKHVSYGVPLMCNQLGKTKNACDLTCPAEQCTQENSKTLRSVQEIMGTSKLSRVLPRHFDLNNYANGVYNADECVATPSHFATDAYRNVPTYSTVRVDTVAELKNHILNAPVVAYVQKTIFDTNAAVFDINSYGYEVKANAKSSPSGDLENELKNNQDVRAVLLIGWGTTGSTLFWRALAPYGSTKGSYGVVQLTQPSSMSNDFFRTIGIAEYPTTNQNQAFNEAKSSGSDSKLSAAAIVFMSLGGVALICLTLYFCRSSTKNIPVTDLERQTSIEIQK